MDFLVTLAPAEAVALYCLLSPLGLLVWLAPPGRRWPWRLLLALLGAVLGLGIL